MTHLIEKQRAISRPALHWENLDHDFVVKVAQTAPPNKTDLSDLAGSVVAACIALMLVALYTSIVFHLAGPGLTLLLVALPTTLGTTFRAVRTTRHAQGSRRAGRTPLRGRITEDRDHLASRFAAADLTAIERSYADLLLCTLDVPPAGVASRQDQQLLVQEASRLLTRYASLERQRAYLLAVSAMENLDAAAVADFRERLAASTDPALRESLESTLELCARYGATVQAIEPLLARIDAYQENIRQALRLARATLTYQSTSAETRVPPPVENLQTIALRLAHQTRAAEEAVLELNAH